MIYLDNNSATRLAPEVAQAMNGVDHGGQDPTTVHEDAVRSVARLLGVSANSRIVFTSDAEQTLTEEFLSRLDVKLERPQIVTTVAENEGMRRVLDGLEKRGFAITRVGVNTDGALDLDELRLSLDAPTAIVSIGHASEETGRILQIEEASSLIRERSNALIHVDGSAAAGRIPNAIETSLVDLYSISAHAFHGPEGIAALVSKGDLGSRVPDEAADTTKIAGLGAAADLVGGLSEMENVQALRATLESEILEKIPNSRLNCGGAVHERLPNTSSISFENTNGEAIAAFLMEKEICVSTASACYGKDHQASAILTAMDIPYSYAMGSVRFSLSRYSTRDEIDQVLCVLPGIVAGLRRLAGI